LNYLGLAHEKDLGQFIVFERKFHRLAFRAIASDTNERTLIAAILPKDVGAQHSLWLSIPTRYYLDPSARSIKTRTVSVARLLFCQAIFNSLTMDWVLRASVAMNVTKSFVARLPIPQPDDKEIFGRAEWLEIVRDSAIISVFRDPSLLEEIQLGGISDLPRLETEKAFDLQKAALELKIARLYGLTASEFEHIISNFHVLFNNKPEYIHYILKLVKENI
jgi:hypothetical protein